MAYVDLTPQEKTELQDWLQFVRPIQGELARALNHLQAARDAHASHVGAILAQLVDSDSIPNLSGLAGATLLFKSELVTILSQANALLTNYDISTNRQLWTKFCGAENLIG